MSNNHALYERPDYCFMTDYPDPDFFDDHDTYDRIYCDEQTDDEYLWDDFSPDPYASVDNF